MKAKEYLMQVSKIDRMITNKIQEVKQWKDIALSSTVSSDGDRVQASGSQQRMADAVGRYVDIEKEINADIDRLVDVKREVIKTIEMLPEAEYDLLHMIYIQGMDLIAAAESEGKTYTWATTTHGRALSHLQKILDEREQVQWELQ